MFVREFGSLARPKTEELAQVTLVLVGPLKYATLEESYQAASVGREEPTELRMSITTLARVRNVQLDHGLLGDSTRFNQAEMTRYDLPDGVIWYYGSRYEVVLILSDNLKEIDL